MPMCGHRFMDDRKYKVADLLTKPQDKLLYTYDLRLW